MKTWIRNALNKDNIRILVFIISIWSGTIMSCSQNTEGSYILFPWSSEESIYNWSAWIGHSLAIWSESLPNLIDRTIWSFASGWSFRNAKYIIPSFLKYHQKSYDTNRITWSEIKSAGKPSQAWVISFTHWNWSLLLLK